MVEQIKNLAGALVMAAKGFAQDGKILAEQERTDARLEICAGCECFDGQMCSSEKCPGVGCGCVMSVKARLEHANCPRGIW